MISTVISASSSKSVFGQDGPLNINLMKQTICRKLIVNTLQNTYFSTFNNIFKINLNNVIKFVQGILYFPINNPQITKAPSYFNLKSKTSMSRGLSMRVGISEAIRLFSTISNNNINNKFNEKKFNE